MSQALKQTKHPANFKVFSVSLEAMYNLWGLVNWNINRQVTGDSSGTVMAKPAKGLAPRVASTCPEDMADEAWVATGPRA